MHRTLETELNAWVEDRRKLLDEVDGLEPDRLVAKPLAGKWSILEIVEHLVLGDRDVLQGLPDPATLVDRQRRLKDRVNYPLVMFWLACHLPAKVPTPRMIPRGESSLAELRREWDEIQQWLLSYVGRLDRRDLAKSVFAHPIAGPLTVRQVLHMGALHMATHTRQIRRLESLTKN